MGNRDMFVGLDVHKESIDVSTAEGGQDGTVRHKDGLTAARTAAAIGWLKSS